MKPMRAGFTLVEISLVLVIIGLLVGGVLAGKSLIDSSKLRSVITQETKFQTAVTTFKDQYRYFPGDTPQGYALYGAQVSCTNDTSATGCNGDGNGYISAKENLLVWMHLAHEGLIEGGYDGSGTVLTKTNVPPSRIENLYWLFSNDADDYGGGGSGPGPWFQLGSLVAGGYAQLDQAGSLLQGDKAYLIDRKVDDGFAQTGWVQSNLADGCQDYGTGQGQGYNNAGTAAGPCQLYFQYR